MLKANIDVNIDQAIKDLNRFGEHLKNQAIRAGVVAGGKPFISALKTLAARYRGKKPPTRSIRGTNVARRHLADSIDNKVWRMPDGSGYVNFVGPATFDAPHAHWFGDRAPTNRWTKPHPSEGRRGRDYVISANRKIIQPGAEYRGTMFSGHYKGATGGGPARIFSKAESQATQQALSDFKTALVKKVQEFQ